MHPPRYEPPIYTPGYTTSDPYNPPTTSNPYEPPTTSKPLNPYKPIDRYPPKPPTISQLPNPYKPTYLVVPPILNSAQEVTEFVLGARSVS